MTLKLYGVQGSQPFRAVLFLLKMKGIAFEEVFTMPGSKKEQPLGSKSKTFREMCPPGIVPVLEDSDAGLVLWESNAILTYIAAKHGMKDLYPTDFAQRAVVDQWLHWHHGNSRTFTMALFAPVIRPDLELSEQAIQDNKKRVAATAKLLEKQLEKTQYLCGDHLTLADIAVYEDIGQCQPHFCDLFDFSPYPALQRWMATFEKLPSFEETHKVLAKLGKIFKKQK
eukprot:CAMPEP_0203800766 /NCGR_PEP_ID=MMETSP0100_2-20121128/10789_1 /ASSEMBLY_ACC=CAM_ASM_000210 /TAXON_ID=96639 /ORGANISM=" , Strain NY0313808BC1" /LENGTH=225 /DNA_ID=CAMNT_0050707065 /DNA_START=46 /DNA_END=720 /DNA_ORIENTATION=+